jgi:hypothetical protein
VRIESQDPVAAIHDFFRFQTEELETGDSLAVPER